MPRVRLLPLAVNLLSVHGSSDGKIRFTGREKRTAVRNAGLETLLQQDWEGACHLNESADAPPASEIEKASFFSTTSPEAEGWPPASPGEADRLLEVDSSAGRLIACGEAAPGKLVV